MFMLSKNLMLKNLILLLIIFGGTQSSAQKVEGAQFFKCLLFAPNKAFRTT